MPLKIKILAGSFAGLLIGTSIGMAANGRMEEAAGAGILTVAFAGIMFAVSRIK